MRAWLSCLLLVLGTASLTPAEERVEVVFSHPRAQQVVLGPSRIEVALKIPSGAAVARVELLVDDTLVATLTAPPWSAPWDAGDGERARKLEARVVLEDGRRGGATISTSPLKIDQVERVDLVDLYVTVRDRTGGYVTDLAPEDFNVLENGVRQEIARFSTTHQPLRLAIVLDTSMSMSKGEKLERARTAASDFLDVLQPGDEALVVGFSDEVRVLHEFSSDRESLARAIRAVEPVGGTALYDAIWRTASRLAGFKGRRVVVLLSDGRDEAASGMEPGSLHTIDEAIEEALESEVIVFTIGVGRDLDREYAMRWGQLDGRSNLDTNRSLESILRELAEATGGRAFITASSSKIQRAFEQFALDLRHQYSIAYTAKDEKRDGKWRKIRVETPGRDLSVVTRSGYYAAKAQGG